MSALGDLLELLHRAGSSFKTLRADYSVWERPGVKHRAIAAALERRAQSSRMGRRGAGRLNGSFFQASTNGHLDYDEETRALRIWVERPDRFREETRHGEQVEFVIRDGERWWAYDASLGAETNAADAEPWLSRVGGEYEGLADPGAFIAALTFEPLDHGERAGRRVLRARAIARKGDDGAGPGMALAAIGGLGADEYELEIDAAHGVVLYAEARLGGRPFVVVQAEAVAFDEALEPDAFVSPVG